MLNFLKRLFGFKKKPKQSQQPTQRIKKSVSYKTAFDKTYWQDYVSQGFLIRQDVALEIAKDIMVNLVHNSPENKHHEIKIINYLERMGFKAHVSVTAYMFHKLYGKELLDEIKKSFDEDSFDKLVDSINKMPD